VSEIGEAGSPAQVPFMLMLFAVATGVAVFTSALWSFAREIGRTAAPAYLTAARAASCAGAGLLLARREAPQVAA